MPDEDEIEDEDELPEGEGGCLFDEISNLVEPTERLPRDGQAG
jgi:hypothetical protein